jgi:DNA-binding MarR family transcriptional regulator
VDLSLCARCHCLAARRHARAITRHYEARLRRHGLRATQFSILAALALAGPMPMGELAGLLGLERTTLTRGVAPLEREGWVRSGGSGDARERPLKLTAAGRRKLEAAYPDWKAAQDSVAGRSYNVHEAVSDTRSATRPVKGSGPRARNVRGGGMIHGAE